MVLFMAIDATIGKTIYDLPGTARFNINTLCSSSKFPYYAAGCFFGGLTMIVGSMALTGTTFGLSAPLLLMSLVVGSLLCTVGGIMGILYGLDKILPKPNDSQISAPSY